MVSAAAELSNDLPLEVKSLGWKRTKNKSHRQFTVQLNCSTVTMCVCVCVYASASYQRGYQSLFPAAG